MAPSRIARRNPSRAVHILQSASLLDSESYSHSAVRIFVDGRCETYFLSRFSSSYNSHNSYLMAQFSYFRLEAKKVVQSFLIPPSVPKSFISPLSSAVSPGALIEVSPIRSSDPYRRATALTALLFKLVTARSSKQTAKHARKKIHQPRASKKHVARCITNRPYKTFSSRAEGKHDSPSKKSRHSPKPTLPIGSEDPLLS